MGAVGMPAPGLLAVLSWGCLNAGCHGLALETPGTASTQAGSAGLQSEGGDGGDGAGETHGGSGGAGGLAGDAPADSTGDGVAGETPTLGGSGGALGGSGGVLGGSGGALGGSGGAPGPTQGGAAGHYGVRNGGAVEAWPSGPAEARAVVDLVSNDGTTNYCTGTVVEPSWVLTAKSCPVSLNMPVNSVRAFSTVVRYVDEIVARTDPADLELVHLQTPFTDIPQIGLTPGPTSTLYSKLLNSYGYGAKLAGDSCSSDAQCASASTCHAGECLRATTQLLVAQYAAGMDPDYGPELVDLLAGPPNLPGDFGGPSFYNGALASVHVTSTADLSLGSYHDWIDTPSRTAFVTADFNHDGATDFIVTTSVGSSWYYSTSSADTWRLAYQRPDLALGRVRFTPGDFDGDGWTDLIVTVATGSSFFYSNDSADNPWLMPCAANTTSQFMLGDQDFTVGDFDGNGKTDFVVDSRPGDVPEGSSFYYSFGRCKWNTTAYARPELTWGKVMYTPGDFNNDGKTDLIVATPTGSSWLYSSGIDPQGVAQWVTAFTTDDRLGTVTYTPADYDGDGRSDVIVATPTGSRWLYSRNINGVDTFSVGYSRAELPWGTVTYTPGDFDGDGKADFAITGIFGTYWYYSTSIVGSFFIPLFHEELKRGAVQYSVGNFDGTGGADMIITTSTGSGWFVSNGVGAWQVPYSTSDHL